MKTKKKEIKIPVPPEKQHKFINYHGEEMVDNFAHLYDRNDPTVLQYLVDENKYTSRIMSKTKTLQRVLYKEFKSHIDENRTSLKIQFADGFKYYTKKVEGKEYSLHCRMSPDGKESIYLDENNLICDGKFQNVGFLRHSEHDDLFVYGVDGAGNERYSVKFCCKKSGKLLEDSLDNCSEGVEFSIDGQWLYYVQLDHTERAWIVKRHKIGTSNALDEIVFEETDEMFFLTLSKSANGKFIFINSSAQITSEIRYIDSTSQAPIIVKERLAHVNYVVEADDEYFYVLTNEKVRNNYLYRRRIKGSDLEREIVVGHRDFVLIEFIQVREQYLILLERSNCLQNIRVIDKNNFESFHYIQMSDTVFSLWLGTKNEEIEDYYRRNCYKSNILRYTFTSFIQPKQIYDYNMETKESCLVEEEKIPLGPPPSPMMPLFGNNNSAVFYPNYDPCKFVQKRLYATGHDGTAIPVSLVYRKDLFNINGEPNPLLLYGYGAYGFSMMPMFNSNRLSLLDRGFIYCIAHVRGGAELGNGWYKDGKLLKKPNSFKDFISSAEYLIKEGYTSKEKLAIYGRSAGGLLMGAVLNMRPDLFKAALMEVPFVDTINTMFDSSIPWTAFEFEEWGDPRKRDIYDVMKGYCPYTNVKAQNYPSILVVAGLNDPRVSFLEPVKFVAKLRKLKTDSNQLLLKLDDVGHMGNSGQYSNLAVNIEI